MRNSWQVEVRGTLMFDVVQKLKNLKTASKLLNQEGCSDLQVRECAAVGALKKLSGGAA